MTSNINKDFPRKFDTTKKEFKKKKQNQNFLSHSSITDIINQIKRNERYMIQLYTHAFVPTISNTCVPPSFFNFHDKLLIFQNQDFMFSMKNRDSNTVL